MSRYVDLDGLTWDGTPITSKIQEVKTKCGYMSGITTGWLWGDNVPHINLEEHDNKIRAEVFDKIMPIFLDILDEKFPWYEKANKIDELENEWNKLKEQIEETEHTDFERS